MAMCCRAGLLAILAKSIAIAIAILVGNSIAILSAILYLSQYCNTIAILFAILYLERVHTYNMALAVWQSLSTDRIITSGNHDALTLSFLH